jgi:hypothetical protein
LLESLIDFEGISSEPMALAVFRDWLVKRFVKTVSNVSSLKGRGKSALVYLTIACLSHWLLSRSNDCCEFLIPAHEVNANEIAKVIK